MAVFAYGAGRPGSGRTQNDIINAALGSKDMYGNPFELIRLKSTRVLASHTRTHGYQDTSVMMNRRTGEFTIKHRDEGALKWVQPQFGGKPIALLARTPKNLTKLASEYYDQSWVIMDKAHDDEVKALADKRRASMTKEQLKAEEKRIYGMNHDDRGGRVVDRSGRSAREEAVSAREREVASREQNLKHREAAVGVKVDDATKARVAKMLEHGPQAAVGPVDTSKLSWVEIRKLARDMGMETSRGLTRKEMEEFIAAQQKKTGNELPASSASPLSGKDLAEGMEPGVEPEEAEVESVR